MMYAGDELYDDDITSGLLADHDEDERDGLDDDDTAEHEIDTVPVFLAAWSDRVG